MRQLLTLLFLLEFMGFSQQKNFVWFKAVEQTKIPEELKHHDAIYVYDHLAYDYMPDYTTKVTILNKMKILSKKSVDRYSQIHIPANLYPYIESMSARIIKPDGRVNELNQGDIVREGVSSNRDDSYFNYAKFVMSGLEVGDELEVFVRISYPGIFLGNDLILKGPLYSLKSKISITNYLDMDLGVLSSATFDGFKVETNANGGRVFVWEESNLLPLSKENYSIPSYETSFLSFAARFNSIFKSDLRKDYTWFDFASELNKKYGSKKIGSRLSSKLREKYEWYANTTSNEVLMYESLNLANGIPYKNIGEDDYYSISDYLNKNEINFSGRIELLVALFDKLTIPFQFGFTRDKYEGRISEKLVNVHQLDRLFLIVNLGKSTYFLFPSEGKMQLFLNEIPPMYEGNNALVIDRRYSEDGQKISFVDIPISDQHVNFRKSKVLFNLDLNNEVIIANRSDIVSGVFSYKSRLNETFLSQKENLKNLGYESSEIDTFYFDREIIEKIYPVKTKVNSQFKIKSGVVKVTDSNYAINLSNMLTLKYFDKTKKERELDFYPLFLYKDHATIYLESDHKIELVNEKNLKTELYNECVDFKLSFLQMSDKMIKIDASVSLKKSRIQMDEYEFYAQFVEKIESLKKANLIFKLR